MIYVLVVSRKEVGQKGGRTERRQDRKEAGQKGGKRTFSHWQVIAVHDILEVASPVLVLIAEPNRVHPALK